MDTLTIESNKNMMVEKPFVLIVEDERDIAALFRHVMDLAGYRTEIVPRGDLAKERLEKSHPDIVFLDLTLPGKSGSEILQFMRSDERLKGIPVVVVTGYPELVEGLSPEPDLVMLKPVSTEQLTKLAQRLRRSSKGIEISRFAQTPWDKITGVYNSSFFIVRLEHALKNLMEKENSSFAVLMLGPTRMDGSGQEQPARKPDEGLLRDIALMLKTCVRTTDTIARFEGDHFFVLLENLQDATVPRIVAARIREKLKVRQAYANAPQFVGSMAILLCDLRYTNVEEIQRDIQKAFLAVFEKKGTGTLVFDHDSIKK
jgi:diguanylate cyclase (GGDEF)-like protein